ncbi:MAG: hypothetical protein U0360_11755 [Dehalococcoidia bacterium]
MLSDGHDYPQHRAGQALDLGSGHDGQLALLIEAKAEKSKAGGMAGIRELGEDSTVGIVQTMKVLRWIGPV